MIVEVIPLQEYFYILFFLIKVIFTWLCPLGIAFYFIVDKYINNEIIAKEI